MFYQNKAQKKEPLARPFREGILCVWTGHRILCRGDNTKLTETRQFHLVIIL